MPELEINYLLLLFTVKPIPDPGSTGQKSTGSRIRNPAS